MPIPILFLDRDGTLIAEPPDTYQVDSLEKLRLMPGVIQNLLKIKHSTEFRWVIVTNQDGLGTPSFPEETFWPAQQKMIEIFEGEGIVFHEVIIDRTFKHEQAPTRKPGTALLQHYFSPDYDLANSFVIGDRPTDVQLAKNLGAKAILYGRSADSQDNDVDWSSLRGTLALETRDWAEIAAFLIEHQAGSRYARVQRDTRETSIDIHLDLDGSGREALNTGLGFFDHMLNQLAKHGGLDLGVEVQGDLHIDEHHTIEDTALALGEAVRKALGDKRGIRRYGFWSLPMDEARADAALDFSGRPWLVWNAAIPRERVGDFPVEMAEHFFKSFCDAAGCNLHMRIEGRNAHHMIEASFKAFARALRMACERLPGETEVPSTKGVL
ncbi:MAG: bifunctional histidinol-phosphatase/imidazoleglycerol-phosphate dehydratase HisB [Bacteroidia bacterium]|nr:bifunctional histidinol-phosphatase/imidazoleglycerol-phosphate dehydratase HisB [Bacteroidia bacterium]